MKDVFLKHKKIVYPVIFLTFSLLLVTLVIFPQISSISSSNQEIANKTKNIQVLEESLSTISQETNLETAADLTNKALPTTKNVAVIFDALLSAAGSSGTKIEEFSLKVGGVYGRAENTKANVVGTPFISVLVRVSGDASEFVKFASEMHQRLPLAEITKIDSANDVASFQINFFYRPQDLSALTKKDAVPPVDDRNKELLQKLSEWDR